MELTYATIVVLASLVFVLSGMVGYLYWQQTRMLQHIQSLAIVVSTHFTTPPPQLEEEQIEEKLEQEPEQEPESEEEDDRVSVKEEVEIVQGPPKEDAKVDVDDLQDKTKKQLQDMLTKKGIPYNKADSKPVLIQLLKATA
jgi:hypothetical protein